MLTGEIRSQIDQVWKAFRSDGISDRLEVTEQITCLLFTKRFGDLHTLQEAKAARLKRPMEQRVFPFLRTRPAQLTSLAELDVLFASLRHRPSCGEL
jgi:hypothetical protein